MKIILSAAVSVDGHIDNREGRRLVLSHDADLEAVYDLRDSCDAILVGANTIRRDNPSLATKTDARRRDRVAAGLTPEPVKVTLTQSGLLSASASFFQDGDGLKLVYCPHSAEHALRDSLGSVAEIVAAPGSEMPLKWLADNLAARGINTLLVEGGTDILTQFLSAGLADEMRLAVAPLFVGDHAAPRLVNPAAFPHSDGRRMILRGTQTLGDTAVLHYEMDRKT